MQRKLLSLCGFLGLSVFIAPAWCAETNSVSSNMPYKCHELKAYKVLQHSNQDIEYFFKGICTLRDAEGDYQDVWIKSEARWEGEDYSATERVTVMGPGGGDIELSMKCEDNPWKDNARCVLLNFSNKTEYASLVSTFRVKKTKEILGYPPISRGAIGIDALIDQAKAQAAAPAVAENKDENQTEKKDENNVGNKDSAQASAQSPQNTDTPVAATTDPDTNDTAQQQNKRDIDDSALDDEKPASADRKTDVVITIKKDPNDASTTANSTAKAEPSAQAQAPAEGPAAAATLTTTGTPRPAEASKPENVSSVAVAQNNDHEDGLEDNEHRKVFIEPTYKGMRLHRCMTRDLACAGETVATKWCRSRGYRYAISYELANDIGKSIHIGDGKVCLSPSCDGFNSITCSRD